MLLWVLFTFVVNPIGDFPLNDDFSFGRTVYNLTEQNQLVFDEWLSMTLIAQVVWGSAFCELFGFSFTTLRISTLIIGCFGIIALYRIGKELNIPSTTSLLVALILAFNPLFFSLSYTFMSDVPFLSMLILSTLFFIKYFKKEQIKWLVIATCCSLSAILIRQLGLMLPLAFTFTWFIYKKWNFKNLVIAYTPLFICLLVFLLYQKWFATLQGIPDTYGTFSKLFKRIGQDNFLSNCIDRVGLLLIYMGLFLLPLNTLFLKKIKIKKSAWVTFVLLCLGLWAMIGTHHRFPWGNILYNIGLGPKLLKDGYFFINVSPTLSPEVIQLIAWIGMMSGCFLIINLVKSFFEITKSKEEGRFPIFLFAVSSIVIYGGFLLLDTYFFDRYFMPLIPFGLVVLLMNRSSATKTKHSIFKISLSIISLILMATFSVTATHDYLSWNRARWVAIDYLTTEKNILPNRIDGGFEFNGWHKTKNEKNENSSKSWWWVEEDDYVVTFGEMNGFKKIKGFPFETYLPVGQDSVFILKKN